MNKFILSLILSVFLIFVVSTNFVAAAQNDIDIQLVDSTIYVQNENQIDIEAYIIFNGSASNDTLDALIELEFSNDAEDFFSTDNDTKKLTLIDGIPQKVKFFVDIADDVDRDTYTLKLNVKNLETGEVYSKNISVNVDDFEDDLEIEVIDGIFCPNDAYEAKLKFRNESNHDYYIKITKLENFDLWPKVSTKEFDLGTSSDEEEKIITVKFDRYAPVGEYVLKLEADLYENDHPSGTPILLKRNVDIAVSDCLPTDITFTINSGTQDGKAGTKTDFYFTFKNYSESNVPVEFVATADDAMILLNQDVYSTVVDARSSKNLRVSALPSESATSGLKTITVKAITPYNTLTQTAYLNVNGASIALTYNVVASKIGLKTNDELKIVNNSNSLLYLNLSISGSDDFISIDKTNVTLNPGEYAIINASIIPKSLGYKKFSLMINGDVTLTKDIYYTVDGKISNPVFVTNYSQILSVKKNTTSAIPIALTNPFNAKVTLTLSLEATSEIIGTLQNIILNANEITVTQLQFFVGDLAVGDYKANILISSELGDVKLPLIIKVKENLSYISELELSSVPLEIKFVPNQDTKIELSVKNPNNAEIKDAVVSIMKDGQIISTKVFHLNGNEIKKVEININVPSENNFIGQIQLSAEDTTNTYEITFVPDNGFLSAGLFSLGIGSTIGIILGVIIIVLIIVLLIINRNKKVIPEIEQDPQQRKLIEDLDSADSI